MGPSLYGIGENHRGDYSTDKMVRDSLKAALFRPILPSFDLFCSSLREESPNSPNSLTLCDCSLAVIQESSEPVESLSTKQIDLISPLPLSRHEQEELLSPVGDLMDFQNSDALQNSTPSASTHISKTSKRIKKKVTKKTKKNNNVDRSRRLELNYQRSSRSIPPMPKTPSPKEEEKEESLMEGDSLEWEKFLDLFLDITVSAKWGRDGIFNTLKNMPEYQESPDLYLNPKVRRSQQSKHLMVLIKAKKIELQKLSSKSFYQFFSSQWSEDELKCLRVIQKRAYSIGIKDVSPFIQTIFQKNLEKLSKKGAIQPQKGEWMSEQEIQKKFKEALEALPLSVNSRLTYTRSS